MIDFRDGYRQYIAVGALASDGSLSYFRASSQAFLASRLKELEEQLSAAVAAKAKSDADACFERDLASARVR